MKARELGAETIDFNAESPVERLKDLTGGVGVLRAIDARQLSTRWLKETESAVGEETGSPARPQHGYGRLVDWLRGRLNLRTVELRLNTAVHTIRWRQGT
jgi:hypothetical protein